MPPCPSPPSFKDILIMKSNKTFLAAAALALLSSATLAQAGTASLAPAGQGPIDSPLAQGSTVSREQIRSQVAQARIRGELVPAGQGALGNRSASTISALTRAEVRTDTLQARNAGDLLPAGQGPIDATSLARQGTTSAPLAFRTRNGQAVRAD
jgi:hypothetical protein